MYIFDKLLFTEELLQFLQKTSAVASVLKCLVEFNDTISKLFVDAVLLQVLHELCIQRLQGGSHENTGSSDRHNLTTLETILECKVAILVHKLLSFFGT